MSSSHHVNHTHKFQTQFDLSRHTTVCIFFHSIPGALMRRPPTESTIIAWRRICVHIIFNLIFFFDVFTSLRAVLLQSLLIHQSIRHAYNVNINVLHSLNFIGFWLLIGIPFRFEKHTRIRLVTTFFILINRNDWISARSANLRLLVPEILGILLKDDESLHILPSTRWYIHHRMRFDGRQTIV